MYAGYFDFVKANFIEKYIQVGMLATDSWGIAYEGLMIRHLAMPENLVDTDKILGVIANDISKDTFNNIMSQ